MNQEIKAAVPTAEKRRTRAGWTQEKRQAAAQASRKHWQENRQTMLSLLNENSTGNTMLKVRLALNWSQSQMAVELGYRLPYGTSRVGTLEKMLKLPEKIEEQVRLIAGVNGINLDQTQPTAEEPTDNE